MSRAVTDSSKRTELLDAAARIVLDEGEAALTIRRLAREVGTSTMGVYTWFGGKPELMRALYREAFSRFDARLRAVAQTDDALGDLAALMRAYRSYALSEPALYEIMFGRSAVHFEPAEDDLALALGTFQILVDHVARAAQLVPMWCPPELAAAQLWAAIHGAVSIELIGHAPPPPDGSPASAVALSEATYDALLRTLAVGLRAG